MSIARCFHTHRCCSRQALYEPYVASLNQEQKKALRKLMAKESPRVHNRMNRDIERFIRVYEPCQSTLLSRKATIERVEHIIRTEYGPEYSVIDRSLYTYAHDLEVAPLELAVHDGSRPTGFLPGTEDQPLSGPYNHEMLAVLLEKHGYTGSFIAGDAERTLPPGALQSQRPQPIEERGELPVNPPWPSFTPRPVPHLTYPPVLYAEHTSQATMPFFLSPPMPTHIPLVRLLQAYCSFNGSYSDFISLVFLWIRSIDLPQLSPTCIALMVIGYLQVKQSVPSLQNPESPNEVEKLAKLDEGVWLRAEWGPRYPPQAFWLETAFITPLSTTEYQGPDGSSSTMGNVPRLKKLGPLLIDFFHFWSQRNTSHFFLSTEQSLSVREGTAVPRVRCSRSVKDTLFHDERMNRRIHRGLAPWSPGSEPIMWQTQPIAIPDPFIPSYNHAQSLSKSAGTYFHYFSSLSYRTLFREHPFATVLGPHLPRPAGGFIPNKYMRTRAYSTGTVGIQAKEFYESMLPPPEVFRARERTISRVQMAINATFGGTYFLESFGSTRYGVSSATSDLDLVIMDPRFRTGFPPTVHVSKLPDVYDMKQVARALRRKGFSRIVAIPKAVVPIVKFHDPDTGLDCDLNTNDQLGLWNTRLMDAYCDLSPDLVRPMIMVIKRWAKSHGLNDPSGQNGPVTFSSYALTLMVIGFLQEKGALPNLQAGLEPLPRDANYGLFWITRKKKKRDSVPCDVRFSVEENWRPETQMELDEGLREWFKFWGSETVYTDHLLSIREGGVIRRTAQLKLKKPKKKVNTSKPNPISLLEWQENVRQQQEEMAVAAWNSQDESEDGDEELDFVGKEGVGVGIEGSQGEAVKREHVSNQEDVEETGVAVERVGLAVEMTGLAVEMTGLAVEVSDTESTDHASRDQEQEEGTRGRSDLVEVVPRLWTAEGFGSQAEMVPRAQGPPQPVLWQTQTLIVADPFIPDRNVCGNIIKSSIERFKGECQRSAFTLACGGELADLMGEGQSLRGAPVHKRWHPRGTGMANDRDVKRGRGKGKGRAAEPAQSTSSTAWEKGVRKKTLAG